MTVNELALVRAFRDAGIEQDKAERLAETIFDAIRDNVVTKGDLQREVIGLRGELRNAVHDLTIRGLFGAVSLFFALLGALHYWPPK